MFRPPDLSHPLFGPFWGDAPAGSLPMPACTTCDSIFWPPAEVCPECLTDRVEWRTIEATGVIWGVAEYWRGYSNELAAEVPYQCVLVDLDCGPRLISLYVGDDRAAPGTPVVAVRVELGDHSLPCFAATSVTRDQAGDASSSL